MKINAKVNVKILCFIFLIISCKKQQDVGSKNIDNVPVQSIEEKKVNYYSDNDEYIELNVDLNRDQKKDKVFSHKKNKGNELIFFINEKGNFKLSLKSINFTEDGGRILKSIEAITDNNNVLKINTYYPNGETNEASYYISYETDWYLSRVVYITSNWKENSLKNQICAISKKSLLRNLNNERNGDSVKQPPKSEIKKYCKDTLVLPKSIDDFQSVIKIEKRENLEDLTLYNQLLERYPISGQNVAAYNNSAYYLEMKGLFTQSIYLLEKIIENFPDRTVAYINLGDAYWGLGKKEHAKNAYLVYVEQMTSKNKKEKIPKRVLERVK